MAVRGNFSHPYYEQLRDQSHVLAGFFAVSYPNGFKMRVAGETERIQCQYVTGNYYAVLGVNAVAGRVFLPAKQLGKPLMPNEDDSPPVADRRLNIVYNWLAFLKREIEAPDLWAAILQEKRLLRITSEAPIPNTQFTPEEKQYVIRQLDEIKQQLITSHGCNLNRQRQSSRVLNTSSSL